LKSKEDGNEQNGKLDSFQNKWYSKHMYSLKEPILYDKDVDGMEIYRYTNLGTWSNPFTYRIEKRDSLVTISKKRTDGQGGYNTGSLIENVTKTLTISDWNTLKSKLHAIRFWELETHGERGMDGEEWIVEGLKDGQYHFTTRWSPDSYGDKKYVELCNLFETLFSKQK
jgi:hypothetical protein